MEAAQHQGSACVKQGGHIMRLMILLFIVEESNKGEVESYLKCSLMKIIMSRNKRANILEGTINAVETAEGL